MNNANGGSIIFHFKGDDSDLKDTKKGIEGLTKSMVISTGVTKALSAGFKMISNSMDDAISRYDTMNNFPKVMQNLGIATEDSQKSIDKMSEALMGLPTTLDQGAMAVQRFTSANGDIEKSTDLFLAVNNAILAGGASSEIQASALEQLSQAYAKGKPDMMEWRTLMTAMPAQLKQVANAMGYLSSADLGEAVREDGGEEEFRRMMETIMQLNKEGVNGFASFETQAKASTNGISTAMKNLKTRVATGVSEMLSAVNKGLEENGFGGIAQVLSNVGNTIKDMLTNLAPYITAIVGTAIQWLPGIIKFLKSILPILAPIFLAVKSYKAVVTAVKVATLLWNGAQMLLNGTLALNPIGLVVAGIVALIATIALLWAKCDWFRNFWIGLWNGIVNVAKAVFNWFLNIPSMVGKLVDDIINFISNIPYYLGFALGFIVGALVKFITYDIPNFITSVIKWFQELPGKLAEAVVRAYNNVTEWFKNMHNKVTEWVSKTYNDIINWFKKLPENMANIGKNIVTGIWEGMKNAKKWLEKKIGEFVNGFVDGIKKGLKIGSPSKVLANSVGQWIPKGIAVGIDANTDAVTDSMEKLQESTLGVFSNPSLENSLHYSPTVIVNNQVTSNTDPLGQTVTQIKTFANGAKNDYNYGMGW